MESRVYSETDSSQTGEFISDAIEAPRYSCALGGAYSTSIGIFGTVPILHSGAGCGIGQLFGQFYGGGQNAGGPHGGTSTPCSSLVEEHVIFGGEKKLSNLIKSTSELVNGELLAVISGCIPSLIGDDVESVVRQFREKEENIPIVHVNTAGFAGNSYQGYEYFFDAVIDQLLEETPVEKGRVNIFGIVPFQHIFWKGEAREIKTLLEKIGLKPNVIIGEFGALENLKNIPSAEYNIVLSSWVGHKTANKLKEKFGTPYISFPGVPVGQKQTAEFLRIVGKKLGASSDVIENLIETEERRAYRFTEYVGDILLIARPHPYFAVVADSNSAVGITKYLTNEMGYLPDIVQITDNPPEEARELINNELTGNLETPAWPDIVYEVDSHRIRQNLKDRSFLFLLASSLETFIAGPEFGAIHLSVAFPTHDRVILERSYAGFSGGLNLMEDVMSKYAGPL
ncbi:nitrogenase component 1 [Methanolobus chelungpuianus]|uniref:Nitrogenase n=1 Tax=Methanolobus chelungpuianus TaxID=502115 RepID=A0AAE3KY59_9EURY|nr:nitrogenase component 1 [Methanolobus chelungpuianus]MCQ6963650.1 nitrogenase [Methanolobus chelungpuianus]